MLEVAEVLLFVILLSVLGITELSRRRVDAVGADPFWSHWPQLLAQAQHTLLLAVVLVVVSIGAVFFALAQERSKQLLLQAEVDRDVRRLAEAETYRQMLLGMPVVASASAPRAGTSPGGVQLRLAERASWSN
jgi:hypothetical protein